MGRCDVGNNFIFLVNSGVSGPLDRIAHPVYSRGGQNFTTFDSIEKSYKKLYMVVFFIPFERISFQKNENL